MSSTATFFYPQDLPKLHTHRAKNLAYCRINGKFRYFGPPGPEAAQKYAAFCAALLLNSTALLQKEKGPAISLLVDAFNQYTARRGVKNDYATRARRN